MSTRRRDQGGRATAPHAMHASAENSDQDLVHDLLKRVKCCKVPAGNTSAPLARLRLLLSLGGFLHSKSIDPGVETRLRAGKEHDAAICKAGYYPLEIFSWCGPAC